MKQKAKGDIFIRYNSIIVIIHSTNRFAIDYKKDWWIKIRKHYDSGQCFIF